MKVKMIVSTYWNGERLEAGDTTEVDDRTGARWAAVGISEKQAIKSPKKTGTDKE